MIALVAFRNDRIVGNAQICKYPHLRRKGTGDALIYLHQDFHNVGLGTLVFKELLNLAEVEGTHRVSLHVVAENSAIHLYENNGSRVEGVMKDAYFGEDGKYHDELVMGLVLASSTSPS
jgi:RimJ/RimL family protein N-acetyltransferase